jgi:hypothetical protein
MGYSATIMALFSRGLGFLVLLLALTGARPCFAQDVNLAVRKTQAAAAKELGDSAMDAGRPADAAVAYRTSWELDPQPALLYNLGRALQALERYPEALEKLEAFASTATPELLAKVPGLPKTILEVRQKITTLSVTVSGVRSADVRLNGKSLGTSPLSEPRRVVGGNAELEVFADGYLPYREQVTLPGGQALELVVRLVLKNQTGVVRVSANVPGAAVTVDGKLAGRLPSEFSLNAGQHHVSASADGYDRSEQNLFVEVGQTRDVRLDLKSQSGMLKKWWFWTAVGVVAAGITVGVVAVSTSEKDPVPGTLAPGVLRSNLQF